jgi:hypothetical protein
MVQRYVRTYRIYLGSGNILMEPNDQYLCIVPAQGAANVSGKMSSCCSRATGSWRSS